jgi:hypothetical protein
MLLDARATVAAVIMECTEDLGRYLADHQNILNFAAVQDSITRGKQSGRAVGIGLNNVECGGLVPRSVVSRAGICIPHQHHPRLILLIRHRTCFFFHSVESRFCLRDEFEEFE